MYNYSIFEQGDCVREFIKARVEGLALYFFWLGKRMLLRNENGFTSMGPKQI